jgi:hypothetical protein
MPQASNKWIFNSAIKQGHSLANSKNQQLTPLSASETNLHSTLSAQKHTGSTIKNKTQAAKALKQQLAQVKPPLPNAKQQQIQMLLNTP